MRAGREVLSHLDPHLRQGGPPMIDLGPRGIYERRDWNPIAVALCLVLGAIYAASWLTVGW